MRRRRRRRRQQQQQQPCSEGRWVQRQLRRAIHSYGVFSIDRIYCLLRVHYSLNVMLLVITTRMDADRLRWTGLHVTSIRRHCWTQRLCQAPAAAPNGDCVCDTVVSSSFCAAPRQCSATPTLYRSARERPRSSVAIR